MKSHPLLGFALVLSRPIDGVAAFQTIRHVTGRSSKGAQLVSKSTVLRLQPSIREAADDVTDRTLALPPPWTKFSIPPSLASRLLERKVTADTTPVPTKMSEAIRVFFFSGDFGPSWIVLCLLGLCQWRLALATMTATIPTLSGLPVGWMDAGLFGAAIVFWWLQEHVLHDKVLHSSIDWVGKAVHQGHHDKPYYHVSIDPAALLVGWMTVAHFVLFRWWLPLPLAVSATLGYSVAGLCYEWAHYIVHTKVRFRSAFWKRVRDNHVRHHRICSDYWFAFSLPAVDDLFGTNPTVQEVQKLLKDEAGNSFVDA